MSYLFLIYFCACLIFVYPRKADDDNPSIFAVLSKFLTTLNHGCYQEKDAITQI